MIKTFAIILLLVFVGNIGFSQLGGTDQLRDSLKHELAIANNDTSRVLIMADLARAYWNNPDSLSTYGNQALTLAKRTQFLRGEASVLNAIGLGFQSQGDYPKSFEYLYKSLAISEENNYVFETAVSYSLIGQAYWFLGDYSKEVDFTKKSQHLFEKIIDKPGVGKWILFNMLDIGQGYLEYQLDSAYHYLSQYYNATLQDRYWHPIALYSLGDCLFRQGDRKTSFNYVRESIAGAAAIGDYFTQAEACVVISRFFKTIQRPDSSIYYATKGLAAANSTAYKLGIYKNSKLLAEGYELSNVQEALYYRKIYDGVNEEMYGAKKVQDLQKTLAEEQQRQQQIQEEQIEREGRLKQYGFIAGLTVLLLIAFILYRNNLQKKKANVLLQQQKEKVESTVGELNIANKQLENKNRDLEIEAALEKVRSRSLAMHKSDELKDVVKSVFERLDELNVAMNSAIIIIFSENSNDMVWWLINRSSEQFSRVFVKYQNLSYFTDLFEVKQKGQELLTKSYPVDKKLEFFNYLFEQTDFKTVPDERKQFILGSQYFTILTALAKNTGIQITSYFKNAFSEQENEILKRFVKVFEQSYTRFLDLQKAEAQAREAQIEASLERVRSKTMAMHTSNDVADTATTMFGEFVRLGIETFRCGIGIMRRTKEMEVWTVRPNPGGKAEWFTGFNDMTIHPLLEGVYSNWENKKEYHIYELKGNDLVNYFERINALPNYTQKYDIASLPSSLVHNVFYFAEGLLFVLSYERLSAESSKIFQRFATVFGQTYRRFLDLQKAEAQARESQIQLALERVRARTMAMQRSDELAEAATVLFEQFNALGCEPERISIVTVNEKENVFEVWTTQHGGSKMDKLYKLSLDEPHVTQKMYAAWKAQTKSITIDLQGNELEEYFQFLKNAGVPVQREIFGNRRIQHVATFSKGMLNIISSEPGSREMIEILERFAGVFDLTYTRFLDLQKAEAQAREAQIEAGLERARAKAMAMHSSEDLNETIKVFYQQISSLSFTPRRCGVGLVNKENRIAEISAMNTTEQGESIETIGKVELVGHPVLAGIYDHWLCQQDYFPVLRGNQIKEYYEILRPQLNYPDYPNDAVQFGHFFFFSEGALYAWTTRELPEEELKIYRRFNSVLSLTYKRYKDLKKAEEQAREAQIEAALERVRSRTTMMQKSEELRDVIQMVFEQLRQLNFKIDSAHFNLNYKESDDYHLWSAAPGQRYPVKTYIPWFDHPAFIKAKEAKEKGLDFYTENYTQEEKNKFFEHLFKHAPVISEERKKYILNGQGVAASTVLMNTISLWIMNYAGTPYSDAENAILKRFGKVFEQTYTRFLDLQKAEAQAREAQIEAALERVRSRSLAMHHSDELKDVVTILFNQMKELGFFLQNAVVIIIPNEQTNSTTHYTANPDFFSATKFEVPGLNHPVFKEVQRAIERGEEFLQRNLNTTDTKSFAHYLLTETDYKNVPEELRKKFLEAEVYCYCIAINKHSYLVLDSWEPKTFTDFEKETVKRFSKVFEQAYIRFLDLQKAEAQAREVVKQAALDRIRADIASMRTLGDLDRIIPLIWNELTTLGIPFIRCGVFIMDDTQKLSHTFLSTPDGKAIAAFHLPYDSSGNFADVVHHWKQKTIYVNHWDTSEFANLADRLVQQGAVASRDHYMDTLPHEGIHLHLLPFLQGMLYVGNTARLTQEQIELIQAVADAFSTAYARYEDFSKLEAAKQQIEKTLTELKQAQTQLIQSEKMASLGALTAGIAHEIQNPLNFVNNFSEVNNELIEELKSEKSKVRSERDKDLEDEILNDIYQNNEKINLHGKRADSIVKGMLQHSRAGSGHKEPTDINKLADEYLRLSYHGMRAKDKSFNAEFKADFDDSIGKINVVPQDIGRVLLNLFNNAFYAVNEKLAVHGSQLTADFKPTVSVQTKRSDNRIEISVRDNASGIPQNIIDKIFQPFFTTKPTGQGTGLGLSLAYDIIKGHGGEIKVQTKEGEGSEFIIQLPAS